MPRSLYFLPWFDKEEHGLFIMFNRKQRKQLLHNDFYALVPDKDTTSCQKASASGYNFSTDKIQYLYSRPIFLY